jgi:hypothetical protein
LARAGREVSVSSKPEIVCLCGSTRFRETFQRRNYEETMAGRIVLSVGCYRHGDFGVCTPEQKVALDELHMRKIDLAQRVIVLNVDGYIGESTRREIAYAVANSKGLTFLEPDAGEAFMEEHSHELGKLVARFARAS